MQFSGPMVKTVATHMASVIAGGVAAISFASSHSVDIYAAYDQLNVVVQDVSKLLGMLTPLATAGYAAYRTTLKNRMTEVVNTPGAVEVAKALPATAQTVAVANALKNG